MIATVSETEGRQEETHASSEAALEMPPAFEPSPESPLDIEANFAPDSMADADVEDDSSEANEIPESIPSETATAPEPRRALPAKPSAPVSAPPSGASKSPEGEAGKEGVTVIPDRVYFRIGDVAEITGIKPYVLRFWEKEFEIIHPVKNNSGQRIYRKSDVEAVLLIKRLLYLERFSIEGAKKRIRELRKSRELGTAKRKRGDLDESKLNALFRVRRGLSDLAEYVVAYQPGK